MTAAAAAAGPRPAGIAEEAAQTAVSPARTITLRISRENPADGRGRKVDSYTVPVEKWTTVLDAILDVKKHMDHSVGVRYSCRQATCGSCGMMINGRPRLACFTKIDELGADTVTVEPLKNFPVVRDLAVGFERMFDDHRRIKPFIVSDETEVPEGGRRDLLQTPEDLERFVQFSGCIKCGLCNAACPTMATDTSFVGPQALAQAYRYMADNRDRGREGRLRIIDDSHGIWRCHFAGSCSQVCPKGVDPAMGIQLLRGYLLGFRR